MACEDFISEVTGDVGIAKREIGNREIQNSMIEIEE